MTDFDWTCVGCGSDLREQGIDIITQHVLHVTWDEDEVDTMEAHYTEQPEPKSVCAACGHEITLEQDYELTNLV